MFELLKPEPVQKLLKAHQSGRQDNHKLLFSLVMFEQWLRRIRSRKLQQDEVVSPVREAPSLAGWHG
jgi:asparagine synthase (glutamine-hydrolysing)